MRHPSIHLPDGRLIAEGLAGAVIGAIGGTMGGSRQARIGPGRSSAATAASTPASGAPASPSLSWPSGLIPVFRGKAVLVDFDQSLDGQARVVMAGVAGLIGRLDRRQATEAELVASIPSFVAQYQLRARFVARTSEAMAFRVMPQDAPDVDADAPLWI